MNKMKKTVAVILTMMMFVFCGCQAEDKENNSQSESFADGAVIGEGDRSFEFSVTYESGETQSVTIRTDKETVGEALLENHIISGEKGPYGLYVKSVNGQRADYEKDGVYWAFYVNGEYAESGVDLTKIKEGERYSFVAEKQL